MYSQAHVPSHVPPCVHTSPWTYIARIIYDTLLTQTPKADPPWGSSVVERPVSAADITDTPLECDVTLRPLELPFAYQYCCPMQTIYARQPMGVSNRFSSRATKIGWCSGRNLPPWRYNPGNFILYRILWVVVSTTYDYPNFAYVFFYKYYLRQILFRWPIVNVFSN